MKKFDEKTFRGSWLDQNQSKLKKGDEALVIEGMDHAEIYAANARQAAYYYAQVFGMTPVAYRGPETGYRDAASYVLKQREAVFVITSPLRPTTSIASSIFNHGDNVRALGFTVPDCESFYHEAMSRGAVSAEVPTLYEDEHGQVKRAAICTYGETIHPIIERKNFRGPFFPGFVPYTDVFPEMPQFGGDLGLIRIDHCVGNVELGKMNHWVSFYENVLGFKMMQKFTDEDISTEYSALMSKVVANGTLKVKFPLNEPAKGKRKSQIDEYLEFNSGAGVQHIALQTEDIVKTITEMRKRGGLFLFVPKAYYDEVPKRVGSIKEDLKTLARLGILVDRDDDGYLLQLFTKPVHDRPTLFFELIQREGSQGFGIGNFKALFESIERDQAARGNL